MKTSSIATLAVATYEKGTTDIQAVVAQFGGRPVKPNELSAVARLREGVSEFLFSDGSRIGFRNTCGAHPVVTVR